MSGYLDSPRYRAALHDFLAAAEQDTNLVDQAQATADVLYTSDETRAKAQKEGKVPYSLLYHSVLHGLVTELAREWLRRPSLSLLIKGVSQRTRCLRSLVRPSLFML